MIANYEIVDFIAIMQHLIDKFTNFQASVRKLLAHKEMLFLISKRKAFEKKFQGDQEPTA